LSPLESFLCLPNAGMPMLRPKHMHAKRLVKILSQLANFIIRGQSTNFAKFGVRALFAPTTCIQLSRIHGLRHPLR
jgi:hypothetical protein